MIASASSFNVSRAPGAPPIKLVTAVVTYAVDAICVLLVAAEAVGTVGTPVIAGEDRGAFKSA